MTADGQRDRSERDPEACGTATAADLGITPPVALASLSGEADAAWARAGAEYVGAAFLGGIALDTESRAAARATVVDRNRDEFLPTEPDAWIEEQLASLATAAVRAGVNVRATETAPIRTAAGICADHGAILEVNAHCRQAELCAVGCGEALLRDTDRLAGYIAAASDAGADVSVKGRAEVEGVDLRETARAVAEAGAAAFHVDAMDSEGVVGRVKAAAPDLVVIANNGVRDRATVREYLAAGADAVSVGRPSDDPRVLARVREAIEEWNDADATSHRPARPDSSEVSR